MWNQPKSDTLAQLPKLYETEKILPKNKIIHLHFFLGGCDWYIAEFDEEDTFWGFVILNDDFLNAEWGYISFDELKSMDISGLEIDQDLFWEAQEASKIDKIRKSNPDW